MFKGNKVLLADRFYSYARKVPNNTRGLGLPFSWTSKKSTNYTYVLARCRKEK
jgi:hypothetical protein